MPGHSTHQPHGSGIRGLSSPEGIDAPSGRFGRMFALPPAKFNEDDLFALAEKMRGDASLDEGPDGEESDFGAAYTYFGQFIDHDITFDPSTFQQQKSDPNAIVDFRTPKFDLDNVYGRGPGDQPYLYDGRLKKMLLGQKMFLVERNQDARDLLRSDAASDGTQRAIIGDPRNDENVIVSQLQGIMQRFHNRMVDLLVAADPNVSFDTIQLEVRRHYQWAVLHDFLPKIVDKEVLDHVSEAIANPSLSFAHHHPKLRFYKFKEVRMPVEFSVAAYRLGHSMVRPAYRVNEFTTALAIFDHNNPTNGLNAFGNFPKSWAIDWQRFIDLGLRSGPETITDRVQRAYKIDTSLVEPLANLPFSIAGDEARTQSRLLSLAFRNLLRAQKLLLPSGQAVAHAMGVQPLKDDEIILFPAEDGAKETDGEDGAKAPIITDASPAFAGKCPLWVYILAESRRNFFKKGRARLGHVGGTIVAETFLALMLADDSSIVNHPHWRPRSPHPETFGLANIIKMALGV
ncbi:MAG TPA: heme peroxidase family protein [Gemmatimonadaceae bacterium]|nr:heme peroxidase family protein [Gemmatimonadaceae bacterium]